MTRYLIIANGTIRDYDFSKKIAEEADFIICADGGAKHLIRMGIMPDLVIGDLDSIQERDRAFFLGRGVEFRKFPARKDETDTELAVETAIAEGPDEIVLLGTSGTRLDHTLASAFLLKKILDAGIEGRMVDEHNTLHLIDRRIDLSGKIGDNLSIIPLSLTAEGICLHGVEYPLDKAVIALGSSLGISNRFSQEKVSITMDNGLLMVIRSRD